MILLLFMCIFFYICKCDDEYINLNFTEIAIMDIDCMNHYNKYVLPYQERQDNIPFDEYLEYWWNLEENDIDLIERVCDMLYNKYPKPNIRRGAKY